MSETAVLASLQDTIGALQSRIRELEDLLQSSMDENISLVQKAARADPLQQQMNRLLGD
jgi:TolA-binding protein